MSTASNDLQQINLGIDTLGTSFVTLMDAAASLERRLAEPVQTWTLNSSAACAHCLQCRFHRTCWNYGDPALRRSSTTTGLSLSA